MQTSLLRVVWLTVTCVSAGCAADATVEAHRYSVSPPAAGSWQMSPSTFANTVAHCPASVVHIQVLRANGETCTGTGVLIERGRVLTAKHVVDQAQSIQVIFGGRDGQPSVDASQGRLLQVEIIPFLDLCVLSNLAIPDWARPVQIADDFPKPGSTLVSAGLEKPDAVRTRSGKTVDYSGDSRMKMISVLAQPGDSGGPVFDLSGRLVAINTAVGLVYRTEVKTFTIMGGDLTIRNVIPENGTLVTDVTGILVR